MILGCPVIDQEQLTIQLITSLDNTVQDKDDFELVIIDNGSDRPLPPVDFPLKVVNLIYGENRGYYYPLLDLYNKYDDELIGLVHNDIVFYEQGWDVRAREAFTNDPKLGLLGLCGSWEADELGGRGAGTMCFFRGEIGQSQAAGARITDVRPAVLLDSIFMLFRREAIPDLLIDDSIAPCHFYDKIWSCRMWENNWHVAVLGSEIDHLGGQTAVGVAKYNEDAIMWCDRLGIDYFHHTTNLTNEYIEGANAGLAVYLEAERRFLGEYRDTKKLIPCVIDQDYNVISKHR